MHAPFAETCETANYTVQPILIMLVFVTHHWWPTINKDLLAVLNGNTVRDMSS